jgi:hypothetical protein
MSQYGDGDISGKAEGLALFSSFMLLKNSTSNSRSSFVDYHLKVLRQNTPFQAFELHGTSIRRSEWYVQSD